MVFDCDALSDSQAAVQRPNAFKRNVLDGRECARGDRKAYLHADGNSIGSDAESKVVIANMYDINHNKKFSSFLLLIVSRLCMYVPHRNINGIVFLYFTAVLWYAFISPHPLTSGDDGDDDGVDWAHGNATTKWCFAVTDSPFLSLSLSPLIHRFIF